MKQKTLYQFENAMAYIDAAMNNLNVIDINDIPEEAVDTFKRYRGSVGKMQVLSEIMHKYLSCVEVVNDIRSDS